METSGNTYDEKPIIGTSMSVELCLVCGDRASGRHYGAISCEGCKGFFKRSIRKQLGYQCRGTMNCEVTKHHRNRCQFCRLQKCLASGMRSDSVQHERKPIVEKKEIQSPSNNSTSCSGSSTNPNTSLYHHRSKVYQSSTSSQSNVISATASNLNVFPVGFNFADLTQTLSKRALLTTTSYQQQQQQQQQQDTYKYSPGTQTNDDDSMDNNSIGVILPSQSLGVGSSGSVGVGSNSNTSGNCGNELSSSTVPVNSTTLSSATTAAANIIQSSFEKNLLTQSLDLIATVQQQYERGNNITSSNCQSGTVTNNNNTNLNSTSCNNIVKEELIIDEHSITNRDLIIEAGINRDDEQQQLQQIQQQQQIFELPILPEINVNFNLQCPALVPSYLNVHYVCECGSRLLFLSVYWIKKIPAFQQLTEDIQIKLLRYHWIELFTIGLSQCSRNLSISTIMTTLATNIIQLSEIDKLNAHKIRKMSEHTYQLNEFVQSMQLLNLDEYEYAYIRLILIFNVDGLYIKDHLKRNHIERLQEHALNCLKCYYTEKIQNTNANNNNNNNNTNSNNNTNNNNNNNNNNDNSNNTNNTTINVSNSGNNNDNNITNNSIPDQNLERFVKILLRLMQLRSLESDIIEELFFSNLIGQVQIETMIPYILKLGGGGV